MNLSGLFDIFTVESPTLSASNKDASLLRDASQGQASFAVLLNKIAEITAMQQPQSMIGVDEDQEKYVVSGIGLPIQSTPFVNTENASSVESVANRRVFSAQGDHQAIAQHLADESNLTQDHALSQHLLLELQNILTGLVELLAEYTAGNINGMEVSTQLQALEQQLEPLLQNFRAVFESTPPAIATETGENATHSEAPVVVAPPSRVVSESNPEPVVPTQESSAAGNVMAAERLNQPVPEVMSAEEVSLLISQIQTMLQEVAVSLQPEPAAMPSVAHRSRLVLENVTPTNQSNVVPELLTRIAQLLNELNAESIQALVTQSQSRPESSAEHELPHALGSNTQAADRNDSVTSPTPVEPLVTPDPESGVAMQQSVRNPLSTVPTSVVETGVAMQQSERNPLSTVSTSVVETGVAMQQSARNPLSTVSTSVVKGLGILAPTNESVTATAAHSATTQTVNTRHETSSSRVPFVGNEQPIITANAASARVQSTQIRGGGAPESAPFVMPVRRTPEQMAAQPRVSTIHSAGDLSRTGYYASASTSHAAHQSLANAAPGVLVSAPTSQPRAASSSSRSHTQVTQPRSADTPAPRAVQSEPHAAATKSESESRSVHWARERQTASQPSATQPAQQQSSRGEGQASSHSMPNTTSMGGVTASGTAGVSQSGGTAGITQTAIERNQALVDQVARGVRYATTQGRSEIRMTLTPEHLGTVRIALVQSGDQLVVNLRTQSLETQTMLREQINQLRQALEQGTNGQQRMQVRVEVDQTATAYTDRQAGRDNEQRQGHQHSENQRSSQQDHQGQSRRRQPQARFNLEELV